MAKITKAEQEIIDTAIKRLKMAVDADNHNRIAAVDDLKFAMGDQWPAQEKKRRNDKGRPALVLNLLPKYIDQVVGDMLHNTPSIKIRPENSKGDINIAKIRQGIISNIEYNSNSKGIYGYAARQQVTSGYGAWRVLTRYTEENPFLQEIYLEGVRNPFLVYMDPSSKDQNYADAKFGFLLERVPRDEFKERYPKATIPSDAFKEGKGLSNEMWYDSDNITVAEYFTRETITTTMHLLEDGAVMDDETYKEARKEWKARQKAVLAKIEMGPQGKIYQVMEDKESGLLDKSLVPGPPQGQPLMPGPPGAPQLPQGQPTVLPDPIAAELKRIGPEPIIVRSREVEQTIVKHRIVTCMEIIEGGKDGKRVAGKYIPLVLLKGKELNVEGKNYVFSLIRNGKDGQKMYNYWNTAAAETIALAPKAPWLGTAKQFEGYENDYATANVENYPFLKYNVDPEAPGPPQRNTPAQPPVAIFEQIRRGEDTIKSIIGMFNADVGAPGSEQTGAAITARQRPGDVATFEFGENLARAINYTGKIINEMIPDVYDSERDVRVRNIDESESFVPINTTVGEVMKSSVEDPERYKGLDISKLRDIMSKNGKNTKFNDITVGKYDVVVTIGPSYSTQRQESAQHLLQLVQAMPQQMAVAADLIVGNMDFKDAEELSSRLRKPLIAQGVTKPRPGEQPPPPQPPPPQVQLAQAKLGSEKIKVESAKVKLQEAKIKAQKELQPPQPDPSIAIDTQMAQMKLQMEQFRQQAEVQLTVLRDQLAQMQLDHEKEKQQLSIQQQRERHAAKMQEMNLRSEIKVKEYREKENKKYDPTKGE